MLVYLFGFSVFVFLTVEHKVYEYSEDKSGSNRSKGYFAEAESHSADAGNEYGGGNKEVAVITEVNILEHLESADGDEAVKGDAHAAHYTGGDSGKEGYERSKE